MKNELCYKQKNKDIHYCKKYKKRVLHLWAYPELIKLPECTLIYKGHTVEPTIPF